MQAFFKVVRPLFGGKLTQTQVDALNTLLSALYGLPLAYQAYLLATVFHETARTMLPITEYGVSGYFDKYEPSTKIGKGLGNTRVGDGYLYRGRGYVQITGRANYAKAGSKLGFNLIASPDLALRETIAAKILVLGTTEGWFTGKRLGNYLDHPAPDYLGARRVINGTDDAALIAGYARKFEAALQTIQGI